MRSLDISGMGGGGNGGGGGEIGTGGKWYGLVSINLEYPLPPLFLLLLLHLPFFFSYCISISSYFHQIVAAIEEDKAATTDLSGTKRLPSFGIRRASLLR